MRNRVVKMRSPGPVVASTNPKNSKYKKYLPNTKILKNIAIFRRISTKSEHTVLRTHTWLAACNPKPRMTSSAWICNNCLSGPPRFAPKPSYWAKAPAVFAGIPNYSRTNSNFSRSRELWTSACASWARTSRSRPCWFLSLFSMTTGR